MFETGALIIEGIPVWHEPEGRNAVFLPDSQTLWDLIWQARESLDGFAHSHPGNGIPSPSHEDITTFAAIESALGKRFTWWITSSDKTAIVKWCGPGKLSYAVAEINNEPDWIHTLRSLSEFK